MTRLLRLGSSDSAPPTRLLRLGFALEGNAETEEWIQKRWLDYPKACLLGDLYKAEASRQVGTPHESPPVFDPENLKDEDEWFP